MVCQQRVACDRQQTATGQEGSHEYAVCAEPPPLRRRDPNLAQSPARADLPGPAPPQAPDSQEFPRVRPHPPGRLLPALSAFRPLPRPIGASAALRPLRRSPDLRSRFLASPMTSEFFDEDEGVTRPRPLGNLQVIGFMWRHWMVDKPRSEERRVGNEGRSRWSPEH